MSQNSKQLTGDIAIHYKTRLLPAAKFWKNTRWKAKHLEGLIWHVNIIVKLIHWNGLVVDKISCHNASGIF